MALQYRSPKYLPVSSYSCHIPLPHYWQAGYCTIAEQLLCLKEDRFEGMWMYCAGLKKLQATSITYALVSSQ
jgi:hypothetical protein